jgi:Protein of unknown function (DUF4238)
MSGIRQHYLPQFLQRGFADDSGLTWLFRKNEQGRHVSIRDVGVERTFYTNRNDTSVDDAITSAEADFSRVIRELRSSAPGPVNSEALPSLFSHLEVRTRHFRQSFQEASQNLYGKAVAIFGENQKLQTMMAKHISDHPENLEQIAKDSLQEKGLPESGYRLLAETVAQHLPQLVQALAVELDQVKGKVIEALPKTLGDSIKNSHINALRQAISPKFRTQQYERLPFNVEHIAEANMILGDCGTLFHVQGSKPFKAVTDKNDVITAAILPISPSRILVGSKRPYSVDASMIRSAIARCSSEFFIASENLRANTELAKSIGLDAALLTDKEIADIVGDITS